MMKKKPLETSILLKCEVKNDGKQRKKAPYERRPNGKSMESGNELCLWEKGLSGVPVPASGRNRPYWKQRIARRNLQDEERSPGAGR